MQVREGASATAQVVACEGIHWWLLFPPAWGGSWMPGKLRSHLDHSWQWADARQLGGHCAMAGMGVRPLLSLQPLRHLLTEQQTAGVLGPEANSTALLVSDLLHQPVDTDSTSYEEWHQHVSYMAGNT